MTELTAETFNDLCRTGPVQAELAASEANHAELQRKSRTRGLSVLGLTAVFTLIAATVSGAIALFVAVFGLAATSWAWRGSRAKAATAIKDSVLPHIAERAGLAYERQPSDPEGFKELRWPVFAAATDTSFSDRFRGRIDDREAAFYEATVEEEVGRGQDSTTSTLFRGQIFWLERRAPGRGRTVVVPDRKMFNFIKPAKGMERVAFASDPEFEKRFEVYSEAPAEAEAVLGSAELRARLVELRGKGALFLQMGERDILVAVPGRDRFEPGDMAKKLSGEARARKLFDDVRESVSLAKDLSRRLP